MQEEIEQKSVQLAIRTGKVTAQVLFKALMAYLRHQRNRHNQQQSQDGNVHGHQTVRQLMGQGDTVNTMDISDEGVRDFQRIANRYGVDFAIVRDRAEDQHRHLVFFKARDVDAINQVVREYSAHRTRRQERHQRVRESVRAKLKKFKELAGEVPRKLRERRRMRELL